MNEILIFIIAWTNIGAIGWVAGTLIDGWFYKKQKIQYKMIPLCMGLGPIMVVIIFKVSFSTWMDMRKEKTPWRLKLCFKLLDKMLTGPQKEDAKRSPEFPVWNHHGLGRHIRNEWGLWSGSKLKTWFEGIGVKHPDDMSGIILDSYHLYLNGRDIELDKQINSILEYWKRENG